MQKVRNIPRQENSNDVPAAQLLVSGDWARICAVFAEYWLDSRDYELLGFQASQSPSCDLESGLGDQGFPGIRPPPPNEFAGGAEGTAGPSCCKGF